MIVKRIRSRQQGVTTISSNELNGRNYSDEEQIYKVIKTVCHMKQNSWKRFGKIRKMYQS